MLHHWDFEDNTGFVGFGTV